MTVEFVPAVRQNISLLIGIGGPSGGGKTYSALRLATGLAGGKPFAVIDTENGRALHYADEFDFHHAALDPPFIPERYADAINTADDLGYPVVVVDSGSHLHAGEGGLLDMHEEILQQRAGDDARKRDALNLAAWIEPKRANKRFVYRLTRMKAHVILCLRAEQKTEMGKENGRTVVRPKRSLIGLDGWEPICEKNLPFEATMSFLCLPDRPGVPQPIKIEQQHRHLVPLDQPLSEETGAELAAWAAGAKSEQDERVLSLSNQLLECADELGNREQVMSAVQKNRRQNPDGHVVWLQQQLERAQEAVANRKPQEVDWGEVEGSGQEELSVAS